MTSLLPADYHFHSRFSPDSREELRNYLLRAQALKLPGLCVTDHAEFDPYVGGTWTLDFAGAREYFEKIKADFPDVELRFGYELGIPDTEEGMQAFKAEKGKEQVDFVIASVHYFNHTDVFEEKWYEGRSYEEACRAYLEAICVQVQKLEDHEFDVIGHFDCPCKVGTETTGASDPRIRLSFFADELDFLGRYLKERGKSVEINTSSWRRLGDLAIPGLDYYSRLRDLGIEYVTFGSDAHQVTHFAHRFEEARELAKAAGFKYYAVFKERVPEFIPL